MVQSLTYLLDKHKDLSLIPRIYIKSKMWWCIRVILVGGKQEVEGPGTSWPASLVHLLTSRPARETLFHSGLDI